MRKAAFVLAGLLIAASCMSAQTRQTGHLTFESRGEVIGRLYRLGLENKPEHIPVFCEALKDKNPRVREAAIAQLVFTHDESAVKPVIAVMKDRSRMVRRCAIAVLERIGSKKAIPALKKALTYRPPGYRKDESLRFEEHFNRLAAAMALHRLGSKAGRGTVLESLKNPSHKSVQSMALKAVIVMDMKKAIPECIRIARGWKYFGEDSPGFFALRAIWHVGTRKHRKEIVKVALEKNDAIGMHARIWTLALLVKFGDERVASVFKEVISNNTHEHQHECIRGLEKFKPEGAAELIVKHVIPPREYNYKTGAIKWRRNYKLFEMACNALGTLGDKSVIPEIKNWYKFYNKPAQDWFYYRLYLAWTLARLDDAEGTDHLHKALTHDDAAVRRLAAKLLGKLSEKKSVPMLAEALKKETEPYTFEIMKRSIGKLGKLSNEVVKLDSPPEPPAPKDTYGKPRYIHFNFDDCATVEAMERITGLMEELASANVRWVFTIYYAPLSRHDHEYGLVLVQRCFDRGCEIENHTLYHNPDGHQAWCMTDEEARGNVGGCNNWLRAYIMDLDKIYRWKGGGGGFRRPEDPKRSRRDMRMILREANFTTDMRSWWRAPSIRGWDMFAPPFHPRPERDAAHADGAKPRLVSPRCTGDLRYGFDAEDPDERIRAFVASFDYEYFNRPDAVMMVIGHDWPNSTIPDRPGNEVHWQILSSQIREILLNRKTRHPLVRAMTNLELAYIFNKKVDPVELITRKVHLQTGKW